MADKLSAARSSWVDYSYDAPRRRDQNGADSMVNASPGRLLLHCTKKLEKEVVKAPTVLIIAEVRQAMCDEMNSGYVKN